MTLPPEVLVELEGLIERATPGPWAADSEATNYFAVRGDKRQVARTVIAPNSVMRKEGLANASLIAGAVNNLPALISTARSTEAMRAENERLKKDFDASRVHEVTVEGGGFWRPCSGCYETNEGYDVGQRSHTFRCHMGGGCSECGGLGAVWDTTDYGQMADDILAEESRGEAAEVKLKAAREALEKMAHAANEWADAFYNASEWVKLVQEGGPAAAGAQDNLTRCAEHCQAVWAEALNAEASTITPTGDEDV